MNSGNSMNQMNMGMNANMWRQMNPNAQMSSNNPMGVNRQQEEINLQQFSTAPLSRTIYPQPPNQPQQQSQINVSQFQTQSINSQSSFIPPQLNKPVKELLVLKPTNEERAFFSYLFEKLDTERKGRLSGRITAEFLKKSELSKDILKQIWYIASQTDPQMLEREEFYVALRLIALAQNSLPYTEESIRSNHPLPPLPRFNIPFPSQTSMPIRDEADAAFALERNDIQKYSRAFSNSKEYESKLSLPKACQMWRNANLSDEAIANLLRLVNPLKENGLLSLNEFIVCTHLGLKSFQREMPKMLPKCLSLFLRNEQSQENSESNKQRGIQLQQQQLLEKQKQEEAFRQQELLKQQQLIEKQRQEAIRQQQLIEKQRQEEAIRQQQQLLEKQRQEEAFRQQLIEKQRQQELVRQQQLNEIKRQEELLQQQRQQEMIRQQQLFEIKKQEELLQQRRQQELLMQQQLNKEKEMQEKLLLQQQKYQPLPPVPQTSPLKPRKQDKEQEMSQVQSLFEEIAKVVASLEEATERNDTAKSQINEVRRKMKKEKDSLIKMSLIIPQKFNEIELSKEELAKVKASFIALMNDKQQLEVDFMKEKLKVDKVREQQATFNKAKEEEMKRNAETMKKLDNSLGNVKLTDSHQAKPIHAGFSPQADIRESPQRPQKEIIVVSPNEVNAHPVKEAEVEQEVFEIQDNIDIKVSNEAKELNEPEIQKTNEEVIRKSNEHVNADLNRNEDEVKLDDDFDPYAEFEAKPQKNKPVQQAKVPEKAIDVDLSSPSIQGHPFDFNTNKQTIQLDFASETNNPQLNTIDDNIHFNAPMSPIQNKKDPEPSFDSELKLEGNKANQSSTKPEDFDTFNEDFKKYSEKFHNNNGNDLKDDWDF